MSLAAGDRLGPFEILQPLGAGGMGEVYCARDTRLDRTVAIKVLSSQLASNPQAVERFRREARAASALNHPHICTVFDVGADPPYLAMELDRSTLVTARVDRRAAVWVGDAAGSKGADVVELGPGIGDEVAWAGDRLLYTNRGGIWVVTPGAGPGVELVGRASAPAASADGRVILFQRDEAGDQGGTWKVNAEGRDAVRISAEPTSPIVAADGRSAVIMSSRGGRQSLWLSNLSPGMASQIVREFVPGLSFDISADGSMLAYLAPARDLGRRLTTAVLCHLPDCSNPRTVALPPLELGRIRWTPNGRGIVFTEARGMNLVVQPLGGTRPYPLTQFTDRTINDFAFSADGKRLAISRSVAAHDIVLFNGFK